MEFIIHKQRNEILAELAGDKQIVNSLDDAIDLLGNANYQGAEKIILHRHHLHPDFFVLDTGLAGEILQKFSNYRMKLVIVGNFEKIQSKALKDFIYESNKLGHIKFLETI